PICEPVGRRHLVLVVGRSIEQDRKFFVVVKRPGMNDIGREPNAVAHSHHHVPLDAHLIQIRFSSTARRAETERHLLPADRDPDTATRSAGECSTPGAGRYWRLLIATSRFTAASKTLEFVTYWDWTAPAGNRMREL